MDFKRMPSLEYRTGVQISLAILYNPRVLNLAFGSNCYFPDILKEVYDILDDLRLPTSCSVKIKMIAMNMIQELLKWKIYHSKIIIPSQLSTTYLCWTTLGAIDKLKTARKLLDEFNLNIINRFWLACKYCFFQDIHTIWNAMSEREKRRSHNGTKADRWIRRLPNPPISLISYINDNEPQFDHTFRSLFIADTECEILTCNEYELRFFLDHKTPAEQTFILRTLALSKDIPVDVRLFCFQQLNEETQELIIETLPVEVLLCFLKWPYQSGFLDLLDRVWNHIHPEDFCYIIQKIIKNLKNNFFWQNFELVEILQQFWLRSPAHFKDRANQSSIFVLLNVLLNCKSLESLNMNRLDEAYATNVRPCHVVLQSCVAYFN